MSDGLPVVHLARHGETAWSLSGQHTGLTDLPLTASGERNAINLGIRLRGMAAQGAAPQGTAPQGMPAQGRAPQQVLTSPLQRARRTCELAGFGDVAQIDADLVEWNYGAYEGRRSAEILAGRPDWKLFRDGCPDGESPAEVMIRARRVVARLRTGPGDAIVFSSGHFLRVLTACWLGLEPRAGALWILGTASLSALGYEHDRSEPVIRFWNDMTHVTP